MRHHRRPCRAPLAQRDARPPHPRRPRCPRAGLPCSVRGNNRSNHAPSSVARPRSPFAPDDPDLLTNRPILDRFVVTSAGIVANIVFAFAVLFGQVSTVGVPDPIYQPGVQVPMVLRGSPGEKAGVKAGDVILSVGGQAIPAGEKAAGTVVGVITSSPGVEVELGIVR